MQLKIYLPYHLLYQTQKEVVYYGTVQRVIYIYRINIHFTFIIRIVVFPMQSRALHKQYIFKYPFIIDDKHITYYREFAQVYRTEYEHYLTFVTSRNVQKKGSR